MTRAATGYNDALRRGNELAKEGKRLRDKVVETELKNAEALGPEGEIERLKFLEEIARKKKDAAAIDAERLQGIRDSIVIDVYRAVSNREIRRRNKRQIRSGEK